MRIICVALSTLLFVSIAFNFSLVNETQGQGEAYESEELLSLLQSVYQCEPKGNSLLPLVLDDIRYSFDDYNFEVIVPGCFFSFVSDSNSLLAGYGFMDRAGEGYKLTLVSKYNEEYKINRTPSLRIFYYSSDSRVVIVDTFTARVYSYLKH